MTDPTLLTGDADVSSGDQVTIRLVQLDDKITVIDRPLRPHRIRLKLDAEETFQPPEEVGTYELTGTIENIMYADERGPDFIFLRSAWEIEQVSESPESLELSDAGPNKEPNWTSFDHTDTDIDVDIESFADFEIVEQE